MWFDYNAYVAECFRSGRSQQSLAWILKPRIKSFRKLGCHSPTAGSLIPKPVIVTEAGINLLLCLSVYLLLVNSKMPKTSTAFPLLTKFYGSAIIILVVAMCCTCLVYALYFMNSSGLELHHASVFLRLKVRDMCLKIFQSLGTQPAVFETYRPLITPYLK